MDDLVTTIDLLRHGECDDEDTIFRGRTDSLLSETGWQQMQVAVDGLQADWQRIISSPLLRCQQFAKKIAEKTQTPFYIDDDFCELDFGDWDGQPVASIWKSDRAAIEAFYNEPDIPVPAGESISVLKERVMSAWQRLTEAYKGEHVLIVQHGGTQRVLLAALLQMPLTALANIDVPYACVSRIKIYHSRQHEKLGTVLEFHNRMSELSL